MAEEAEVAVVEVQGEAAEVEEEGEEVQVEGAGAEAGNQGIGRVSLFLPEVSQRVSRPGRRVWLELLRDGQLDEQLAWLRPLPVCEQLLLV